MQGQALPGSLWPGSGLTWALPHPPCSPGDAGLGAAGVHLGWLLGQRSTPGRGHRPQQAALGLHTAHRPLPQATPTGGAAWAEVSGYPAEEDRKRRRALGQAPKLARGRGGRQAHLSS